MYSFVRSGPGSWDASRFSLQGLGLSLTGRIRKRRNVKDNGMDSRETPGHPVYVRASALNTDWAKKAYIVYNVR